MQSYYLVKFYLRGLFVSSSLRFFFAAEVWKGGGEPRYRSGGSVGGRGTRRGVRWGVAGGRLPRRRGGRGGRVCVEGVCVCGKGEGARGAGGGWEGEAIVGTGGGATGEK